MVLLTLGGQHLLYGLVACGLHREDYVEVVHGSEEGFVMGVMLIPHEIVSSNSRRVRCEECHVVR